MDHGDGMCVCVCLNRSIDWRMHAWMHEYRRRRVDRLAPYTTNEHQRTCMNTGGPAARAGGHYLRRRGPVRDAGGGGGAAAASLFFGGGGGGGGGIPISVGWHMHGHGIWLFFGGISLNQDGMHGHGIWHGRVPFPSPFFSTRLPHLLPSHEPSMTPASDI